MKVVIDRFEDNYAVCEKEDKTFINVKKNRIPHEAKEGYVINICGESITVDLDETKKRKKKIEEDVKNLWI